MKAFLLAGGHGTRLRPLTHSVPKCLVPIRGKPLLDIWLDLCARSGIAEVLINLHARGEDIRRHVAQLDTPVKIRLIEEAQLLGSAGTLAANRDWIGDDPEFWILYSDVLTSANLKRMGEYHRRNGRVATIGLYAVPDPSRCGVAVTDGSGVVIAFQEKPPVPVSNWVFSGLMVAGPRLFEFIPSRTPADIAFDVLPHLVGSMMGYPIPEYLLDIGTPANYRTAQLTWPGGSDSLPGN